MRIVATIERVINKTDSEIHQSARLVFVDIEKKRIEIEEHPHGSGQYRVICTSGFTKGIQGVSLKITWDE